LSEARAAGSLSPKVALPPVKMEASLPISNWVPSRYSVASPIT
jgi:hypothetical protein